MPFLIIWVHVSWFTCCQGWDILNPSFSSLELSWVIFHLKLSFKDCRSHGVYQWSNFFIYPFRCDILSRLLVHINTILFPWVAGCHLIFWDVLHKTISSLFFRCWLSNNSVRPFSLRCLFKLFCGRSWHFLQHSFISIINLLFLSPGGSVLWFHEVSSHLIKFLFNSFSFQSECCPKLFSLVPLF